MNTFLFYDTETTGLNPAFDQIVRFAAIRTDMTLNEIDRHAVRIHLRPDIVPSPRALLTHGLGMDDIRSGQREYEAIGHIHRWLNEPGTISIGYNNLNFDDEFLRFSFYRNLLAPYTHQYDRGCMRMDLYPITLCFWLYRPAVIQWPEIEGNPSLKLEHINARNRLARGTAHDAMADAEATLALARVLMGEVEMWNYLSGYFHKTTDMLRTEKLPIAFHSTSGTHQLALMISGEFGTGRRHQAPVLGLGRSIPYANQSLWLRLDLPELSQTTAETIADSTWIIRKKSGEPGLLLPPLERYWNQLDPERQAVCSRNIEWLKSHPDVFGEIVSYHRAYRYPPIPDLDADAALYETGFPSAEEKRVFSRFHAASPAEKTGLLDAFRGPIHRELARRLLARNYPDQATGQLKRHFSRHLKRVSAAQPEAARIDFRGRHNLTPGEALSEIQQLMDQGQLKGHQAQLLTVLADYIHERFPTEPPTP